MKSRSHTERSFAEQTESELFMQMPFIQSNHKADRHKDTMRYLEKACWHHIPRHFCVITIVVVVVVVVVRVESIKVHTASHKKAAETFIFLNGILVDFPGNGSNNSEFIVEAQILSTMKKCK